MKTIVRAILIVPVALALALVLYFNTSTTAQAPSTTEPQECVIIDQGADLESTAASCGRCGDGYCAKQCGETALSCPADCGGSSS